jgi:hypothetical protein
MSSPQRQSRLYAIKSYIEGNILKLHEETELMLNHPTAGQASFLSVIEDNLSLIGEYKSMLAVLKDDFSE